MNLNYYKLRQNNNYAKELQSNYIKDYISRFGTPVKIYKANKLSMKLDDIYGESEQEITFLPSFTIPGVYQTLPIIVELNQGGISETEDEMEIIFHLDTLINKLTEIKNLHWSDIFLTYSGLATSSTIEKNNNNIIIKEDGIEIYNIDLTDTNYNTIEKLTTYLNGLPDYIASYENFGDKLSKNIVDFETTECKNVACNFYIRNKMFDGTNNVIDESDIIVIHNDKMYEVNQAMLASEANWQFNIFKIVVRKRSIEDITLPGTGLDEVINSITNTYDDIYRIIR